MKFVSALALSAVAASQANAVVIFGTTVNNRLISFDSANPGTLLNSIAITGLANGEHIEGIDLRPSNGSLYILGSQGNLYTVSTSTGALTNVKSGIPLNGARFGVDFNPAADALRITSDTNQNLRITAGGTGTVFTDSPLTGPVVHSAYTNNFAGATSTVLYDINTANDTLFVQTPPNSGTLVPVFGGLGVNVGTIGGFDIYSTANAPVGNPTLGQVAYAALTPTQDSITNLYTINLTTGAATEVGQIGSGMFVTGLTVGEVGFVVPEPASIGLLGLGGLALLRRKR